MCARSVLQRMDLTEYQILRLWISTYPVFYKIFIDISDNEFYVVFPVTISCAISFFIPRFKWFFRYILPFIFIIKLSTESLLNERKIYHDISKHDSLQFLLPLICMTCFTEIQGVFNIVFKNVRRSIQFIPGIRVIMFTVYCVFHSVLFVYILYTYVFVILNSGPYHLLHIHSNRSAISVVINPSENLMEFDIKPTVSNAIVYRIHKKDQIESRETAGYTARIGNLQLPIYSRTYYRVEGEDILLEIDIEPFAAFLIYIEESWFSVKLDQLQNSEWTIAGNLLQNDSFRHLIMQNKLKFKLIIISLTTKYFFDEIICWAITKRFSNGALQTIKLNLASFVNSTSARRNLFYFCPPRSYYVCKTNSFVHSIYC